MNECGLATIRAYDKQNGMTRFTVELHVHGDMEVALIGALVKSVIDRRMAADDVAPQDRQGQTMSHFLDIVADTFSFVMDHVTAAGELITVDGEVHQDERQD
ncbi:MAG: hypothetical protein C7B46_19990 [Sulfobacillus benefaciens]|uniref:Uncharacterized protein n=1 Tax=Sulfobacillus benefaciens TaxID=453960 RepID=A0A2T2WW00_9FIRM|nr:MAG: hypothetical protein C7B46_19990 [Sulfobacillus benefaciens]